jgi:hypothetical protein
MRAATSFTTGDPGGARSRSPRSGRATEAVAAPGSLRVWSNPGEQRSVAQVELRPGSPGFEKGLRVVYGLAADGRVLKKGGVPEPPPKRRCCWRWARCACLVPTRRSSESWGCWPSSPGGAASTRELKRRYLRKPCPPQRR